jgi:hypothetical protein
MNLYEFLLDGNIALPVRWRLKAAKNQLAGVCEERELIIEESKE